MDKENIKILLIEDDEDDYALVRELLSEVKLADFSLEWVQTYEEGFKELCRADHDTYLLDYRLGSRSGLELIREATGTGCNKPIILLTGQGDYGVDMEAMRSGAADYLVKAQLTADMLERSIRYSIARKVAELELKSYRNRLEDLVKERTEQLETANEKLRVEITERKRADATLLESEQRVRRLNEQILNMVMVLSHDIRGPLVAIASILKLMLRGIYGKLDQSPANTVQDLLSRCARLLGTADDYLGKASIIGGSMKMEREVLDLRQDIIDAVLEELADDLTKREIVIDNRLGAIPSGSIAIRANKTWLKAVYRNLFSNAVKYGGKGCTISFGFEQHESHYRLNVYNSGRPIAEEARERIFTRFGRIQALEGPAPDGVGLGLCLCREIILEHGGDIWYEARPGGSNFVFTISREDECGA